MPLLNIHNTNSQKVTLRIHEIIILAIKNIVERETNHCTKGDKSKAPEPVKRLNLSSSESKTKTLSLNAATFKYPMIQTHKK